MGKLVGGISEERGASARGLFAGVFEVGALASCEQGDPAGLSFFFESGRAGTLLESLQARERLQSAVLPAELLKQSNVAFVRKSLRRIELLVGAARKFYQSFASTPIPGTNAFVLPTSTTTLPPSASAQTWQNLALATDAKSVPPGLTLSRFGYHHAIRAELEAGGWKKLTGQSSAKIAGFVTLGPASWAEEGSDSDLPALRCTVNAFTRMWLGVSSPSGLAMTDSIEAPTRLLEALDRLMRLPRPVADWNF